MQRKLKPIPKFKNEDEEREFWAVADSSLYFDWSKAKRVTFPNLKLTSRPITLRLPVSMIDRLKIESHKMDIPYQSLIKKLIFDGLAKDRQTSV